MFKSYTSPTLAEAIPSLFFKTLASDPTIHDDKIESCMRFRWTWFHHVGTFPWKGMVEGEKHLGTYKVRAVLNNNTTCGQESASRVLVLEFKE